MKAKVGLIKGARVRAINPTGKSGIVVEAPSGERSTVVDVLSEQYHWCCVSAKDIEVVHPTPEEV